MDAYETGDLRGGKLRIARALVRKRISGRTKDRKEKSRPKALTSQEMTKEYQEYTRTQRALVKRAAVVRERLILIAAACQALFADLNFLTLLRAEALSEMANKLMEMTREK